MGSSFIAGLTLALLASACGSHVATADRTGTSTALVGMAAPTASGVEPSLTPRPLPTKPTPCPTLATSRFAATGIVTWNGSPLAGVRVEAYQPAVPYRLDAAARDITRSDGSYRLAGLVPGLHYIIAVEDQPGWVATNGASAGLCEQEDVVAAPIAAVRELSALSLERGATVDAGPLHVSWDAVAGADEYCVAIWTIAEPYGFQRFTAETCGNEASGERVTALRFTSQALPAGKVYQLAVLARSQGVVTGGIRRHVLPFATRPIGPVGVCGQKDLPADRVERSAHWLFQALDQLSDAEVATCFADAMADRASLAHAFVLSGGPSSHIERSLTARADGVVIEATVTWRDAGQVGTWQSGQTRWLVWRTQADGRWAIEAIATAAPR